MLANQSLFSVFYLNEAVTTLLSDTIFNGDHYDIKHRSAEIELDTESMEYSLEPNLPEWMKGDLAYNNKITQLGQLLICTGLIFQLLSSVIIVGLVPTALGWIRLSLTVLTSAVWVVSYMKWQDSQTMPSAKTAFRSWKINYVAFWIFGSVSFLNLIFSVFRDGIVRID